MKMIGSCFPGVRGHASLRHRAAVRQTVQSKHHLIADEFLCVSRGSATPHKPVPHKSLQ